MNKYYAKKLSAKRLELCYRLANPRIKQYLQAEIEYTLSLIDKNDSVLELGCGYGRIMTEISKYADSVYGIDNSIESLLYGKDYLSKYSNCYLIASDVKNLCFKENSFDNVLCLQNGISAFHVDQKKVITESLRILKPNCMLLISTYSSKIWNERLEWFEQQSKAGLLGKIDYDNTKDGVIVCKDGFSATTLEKSDFDKLLKDFSVNYTFEEVDESSLFCKIIKL